jgi:predicted esterase
VPVSGDLVALVAHGPTGNRRAIVYLHGVCGDVTKYRAWVEAAVHFGTVVAVRGDDKCKEPGRYKWGFGVERTDRRIVAALRAVGGARPEALDTESVTLVGYSQGSARAEALVRAFPSRYRRAVLVAGPHEHEPSSFREALGIAVVAGENDLKTHLSGSAAKAAKAGVRARYFELPGARHGEYGPDAVKVMGDALAWVFAAPDP